VTEIGANLLIPTIYGPMIVNRHGTEFDHLAKFGRSETHDTIALLCTLAAACGEEQTILDIGGCYGVYAIALAQAMLPLRSRVICFEPQWKLYAMICGSISLGNLPNIRVCNLAIGSEQRLLTVPGLDYDKPASFGSLSLEECESPQKQEWLKQTPDPERASKVMCYRLDDLGEKPALIKIDTEGMELDVLLGAERTIAECRPVLHIEWLKSPKAAIREWLQVRGYEVYDETVNFLAIPKEKLGQFPQIVQETAQAA
jgi:FkbM family methyltransferase